MWTVNGNLCLCGCCRCNILQLGNASRCVNYIRAGNHKHPCDFLYSSKWNYLCNRHKWMCYKYSSNLWNWQSIRTRCYHRTNGCVWIVNNGLFDRGSNRVYELFLGCSCRNDNFFRSMDNKYCGERSNDYGFRTFKSPVQ